MKKYFYTVCCFLAATTFALTSCGDDETIIDEPDVPVTPDENPDEEEPETPTTTYAVMYFNLNESSETCVAGGDSVAFFALVDEMLAAVQDSLTNAESTMRIETNDDHSFAMVAESSDNEEIRALGRTLRTRLMFADEPHDFVYTGYCNIVTTTLTTAGDLFSGSWEGSASSSESPMVTCIPAIKSTTWATTDAEAAVQSVTFEAEVSFGNGAYINGNEEVTFSVSREGAQVSLAATDNTYVFHFNENGTELTLVSINGEEVSETYVYTKETPAE